MSGGRPNHGEGGDDDERNVCFTQEDSRRGWESNPKQFGEIEKIEYFFRKESQTLYRGLHHSSKPTAGVVRGVTTYTIQLTRFGGATATLAANLTISFANGAPEST